MMHIHKTFCIYDFETHFFFLFLSLFFFLSFLPSPISSLSLIYLFNQSEIKESSITPQMATRTRRPRAWAKSESHNSTWVLHVFGRGPSIWVILCGFLMCFRRQLEVKISLFHITLPSFNSQLCLLTPDFC